MWQILSPIRGYRRLLNKFVSSVQQATHVRSQQKQLRKSSQKTQRRFEFHRVLHDRAIWHSLEIMIVAKALESTTHHAILKVDGKLVSCDETCVTNSQAEVAAFPSHLLIEPDQASSDSCNCSFTGPIGGSHVKINASGKIEAPLDRGPDLRCDFDADHRLG